MSALVCLPLFVGVWAGDLGGVSVARPSSWDSALGGGPVLIMLCSCVIMLRISSCLASAVAWAWDCWASWACSCVCSCLIISSMLGGVAITCAGGLRPASIGCDILS
jgi:hypothetical protein